MASLRKPLFFILRLLGISTLHAQIPANRIIGWSKVGMIGSIPTFTLQEDILNHGGLANDTSVDNSVALQTLLNNVAGTGTIIYFPAGTYTFKNPVNIPSAGRSSFVGPYQIPRSFILPRAQPMPVISRSGAVRTSGLLMCYRVAQKIRNRSR